jgi:malate dehydrogenase
MSRDDLLSTNAKIVGSVAEHIKSTSPKAIIIVVGNPLDAMVQQAWQVIGFDHRRAMGQTEGLAAGQWRRVFR